MLSSKNFGTCSPGALFALAIAYFLSPSPRCCFSIDLMSLMSIIIARRRTYALRDPKAKPNVGPRAIISCSSDCAADKYVHSNEKVASPSNLCDKRFRRLYLFIRAGKAASHPAHQRRDKVIIKLITQIHFPYLRNLVIALCVRARSD